MTNDITAESLRAHGSLFPAGSVAHIAIMAEADRLDAAQARDTEAEELGRLFYAAEISCFDGDYYPEWDKRNPEYREGTLAGVRAVLDHLASRLAPDNGITLTADEAADVRLYLASSSSVGAGLEAGARLRARFAPTEQAEQPMCGEIATDAADPWACTLDADHDSPHEARTSARKLCHRWGRSWPSLDQVPHDVTEVVSSGDVTYRRTATGWEFLGGSGVWRTSKSGFNASKFTEVVGGVL